MTISIITPAFGQLDWLRMCIASVADQVAPAAQKIETKPLGSGAADERSEPRRGGTVRRGADAIKWELEEGTRSPVQSPLAIEHIIQDGGTPGIEEFAKEMGEELMLRYGGELVSDLQTFELLHFRTASGYTLRVFKEPDAGMYDAINKGIAKISGDLWAWLNCDEQYLPGTLAYVTEWFSRHPETDILCGDALLTDEKGYALSYRRIIAPSWLHTRLVHLASLSCASFYRRSIVERGGVFDTQWRSIGDAEWMARMLKAGIRVKACGHLLSSFAFTGQNTSESPMACEERKRWRLATDTPPLWNTQPVVLSHRLRKIFADAYCKREVTYSLHVPDGSGRVMRRTMGLGWKWGTAE
jgi:glycosyltransferase involved in cell wall biosynthesis